MGGKDAGDEKDTGEEGVSRQGPVMRTMEWVGIGRVASGEEGGEEGYRKGAICTKDVD